MSVVDYLNRLVSQVGQAVSLALSIVTTLITSGWYIVIRDAATVTGEIHGLLDDPTCGQGAQCGKLDSIITTTDDIVTLLNDISTLVGGGRVVNLPTTPPAGYGGASAAAVWAYVPSGTTRTTGNLLNTTGEGWSRLTDVLGVVTMPATPWYGFAGPWDEPTFGNAHPGALQVIDPTTIIAADTTPYEWLHRAYPTALFYDAGGGIAGSNNDSDGYTYLVLLTIQEFQQLKAWVLFGSLGGPPPVVPPVWPGLANVTYGDTQNMDAPNGSLSGPADGYKIVIDATPSWAGKFDFGVVQSWRNVGAISFVSDEGVPEPAQTLGLANVIYTPQRMAHSVGAYYRIATGYHANATPFVLNS